MPENIFVKTVPGTFELPLVAKWCLEEYSPDAVICIGCVITGETKHDQYISQTTSSGIMNLSLHSGKPIIFGVLTPNNMEQANDRAGGKYGNKGVEAASTALQMISLNQNIKKRKSTIGFSQ